jgi:hypothetical protein
MATTSSPRPSAKSISVADGTREAIRTETRMARLSDAITKEFDTAKIDSSA